MAEGKKSFILYTDLLPAVKKMPDDKAGQLFKIILSYVNDENPKTDDLLVDVLFEQVKQQLKRDLIRYEEVKVNKSNGGRLGNLKRWNKDLYDDVTNNKLTLDEAEIIATNRRLSHTDSMPSVPIAQIAVNDNVNVNDNVINNILLSEIKISDDLYQHEFFKIAEAFRQLFIKNRIEQGIKSHSNLEKAKFVKWTNEIKLIIEKDKYTIDQLRDIYDFLNSETQEAKFWKPNIQSVEKLRTQFDKLIFAMNKDKIKQKAIKKQNTFTA